jgi:hypothetical protein
MRKKIAKKSAMSRAQRAIERDKVRSRLEGETVESDDEDMGEHDEEHRDEEQDGEVEAPLRSINGRERKRRKDVSFELGESPKKRLRHDDDETDFSASHRTSLFGVSQSSARRTASLVYQRPNPMNLARSSWVLKAYRERGVVSEDESFGVPEEDTTRALTSSLHSPDGDNWRTVFNHGPNSADDEDLVMSPVGALTFRPTPGNYAKRRWSSDVWASNATRSSSPVHSERSDAEDSWPEYSDDDDDDERWEVDMNVDYGKRYSIYFRETAVTDNTAEVRFDRVPSIL